MTMASAGPDPQDARVPDPADGDPQPQIKEGTHSQGATQSAILNPSMDGDQNQIRSTQLQSPLQLPFSTNTGEELVVVTTSDSTIGEVKGNPNASTIVTMAPTIQLVSPVPQATPTPMDGVVMSPAIHIVSDVPQATSNTVTSPGITRVSDVPPRSTCVSDGTRLSTSPMHRNVPPTSTCVLDSRRLSTTPMHRNAGPSTARVPPIMSPHIGESSGNRSSTPSSGVPETMPMFDHVKQQPPYEELNEIGNGAYGTVYRARDLVHAGRVVALKKIRISLTEEGVPVFAIREIATLKQLERFNHPNIVRLLDICQGRIENDRLTLMLVFEYMDQDLDKYMKRCPSPGLEPSRIKSLIHQVVEGVDFLHSNRVIHRDLKPQNILVDHAGRVKIADFGLARIYDFNMRLTTTVVTLWYRAPEVLLSNSYATPVDMWSCGCIFAELFRRRPIFEGRTEGDQLQCIFDVIGTPLESEWPREVSLLRSNFRYQAPRPLQELVPEITPDAVDLMQKMLKFKPENRISALQAKNHPYFDSLRACSSGVTARSSSSSNSSSSSSSQPPVVPVTNVPLSPIRSPNPISPVPLGLSNTTRALMATPGRVINFSPNKGSPSKTPVLSPRLTSSPAPAVVRSIGRNDENNPNAGNSAPGSSAGSTVPSKPVVTAVPTTSTAVAVAMSTATVSGPSVTPGTSGGTAR